MGKEYTEAQKKATIKYARKRLKRVPLDMQKTDYEKLLETATEAGMSVNGYIKTAIAEKIERDSEK